jgi:hypothetical protein
MHDILDVIKNVQDIYENNTSLGVLKDFERVLDEMDVYVYKNWLDGELAVGPKVERHWISCGFMWPEDKMPDPSGGRRLLELGCKITYERTHLIEPIRIRKPDDFRPGTKKGKLEHKPVWLVTITMPKKLAFDVYKGYMDKMKGESEISGQQKETTATPMDAAATAAGAGQAGGGAAPAAAPAAGGAPAAPSPVPA